VLALPLLPGIVASVGLVATAVALAVSDQVASAVIAGVFSCVNTALLVTLTIWRRGERRDEAERDERESARDERETDRDERERVRDEKGQA